MVGAGEEQQVAGDARLDCAQAHKLRAELLRPLRFLVLVADYELMPELANALGICSEPTHFNLTTDAHGCTHIILRERANLFLSSI